MSSGKFLRNLRENKGFSLRQVSIKSGVSHTQIADIEKGVNYGTREKLDKILMALGASNEEIEKFYDMQDYEKTPESIKKQLEECKKQLNIINRNNSGHIIVGDGNKINTSYIGNELFRELSELNEKEKEKVLKFINDYIKN